MRAENLERKIKAFQKVSHIRVPIKTNVTEVVLPFNYQHLKGVTVKLNK